MFRFSDLCDGSTCWLSLGELSPDREHWTLRFGPDVGLRFFSAMLVGVSPTDPLTFLVAALVLLAVTLVAIPWPPSIASSLCSSVDMAGSEVKFRVTFGLAYEGILEEVRDTKSGPRHHGCKDRQNLPGRCADDNCVQRERS